MASIIDVIGGTLSAGAAGGLFGIVGQVANRAVGIWEAKEKRADQVIANAQEEKRWAHETVLLDLQMKAKSEETENELDLAQAHGSWDGLKASIEAEANIGPTYKWVEAVRALARPALTLEAQLLLAVVFFFTKGTMRDGVVETITFAASASLLWWFGERAQSKAAK